MEQPANVKCFYRMCIPNTPVILVVDDEALIRMAASDMLTECGAVVIEAKDADEALAILKDRDNVALVFSDVNMPGSMDGLALLQRVHDLKPEVELILTSGREYFAKGTLPDDGTFLPKPYSASQLCELVAAKLSPS